LLAKRIIPCLDVLAVGEAKDYLRNAGVLMRGEVK
jgi:hypothetical protein